MLASAIRTVKINTVVDKIDGLVSTPFDTETESSKYRHRSLHQVFEQV